MAEVSVKTEQFDSESYRTTVLVTMDPGAAADEVAPVIDLAEDSSEDFDSYSTLVRLADSDGDAAVETQPTTKVPSARRASWLVAAAAVLPESRIVVTDDRIDVTAPEPTSDAVEQTAERLIGAEGIDGAFVRVGSLDPDETDNRDGGFGLVAPAERLDRRLLRAWDDLLTTVGRTGTTPVTVSLGLDPAGVTTVHVHLDLPSLRSATPALGRHRAELWPTVRALLPQVLDAAPAQLAVEASSADYVVTEPFVVFSTDSGSANAEGEPAWQRLVEREARRLRR